MAVFKCKMCGGTLDINNETVAVCQYCGTKQTLPKLDDDRKANLYDRANHFRRNNEFDKAMGIYEQILNDDNTDAETYWSLVLCRYGIEYVEDPSSHKRIPTVNRAQFTSIFDDEDYKSALQYADGYQKDIYEQEATAINDIQKGILAISSQEEPFDVFICYKESDNSGRRTPDSVLATELYHELTREGYKVFFSRITLEDKLGTAYEPYIFAALNSAKVMVVLGTKPEFFNAVWVKNEWSRYLALIKNGARKMLIPAYKDMDPYDLPEEFSHLQAQDMSKLGFMQDLIRGIKKIVESDNTKQTIRETIIANDNAGGNVNALLKRGFMALEYGEWTKADDFFEQCLNQNAELAEAYLGKLMAELQIKTQDSLKDCAEPFENRSNYQKTVRFADNKLKAFLGDVIQFINERNEDAAREETYNRACNLMNLNNEAGYIEAVPLFEKLSGYKDADTFVEECRAKAEVARKDRIYKSACDVLNDTHTWVGKKTDIKAHEEAIAQFQSLNGWKDSDEKILLCKKKIEAIKVQLENERIAKEQEEFERVEKEKLAIQERKKRKKKILIITSIVVAVVVAFFSFYIPYQTNNNKALESVVTENMKGKVFEKSRFNDGDKVYDKFTFSADGTGNKYSDGYDYINKLTLPFKWKIAGTFNGVNVIINYKHDGVYEEKEYIFEVNLNDDNEPISITGKNSYEGIVFDVVVYTGSASNTTTEKNNIDTNKPNTDTGTNSSKSYLDWIPTDSNPEDDIFEYYKIEHRDGDTHYRYLVKIDHGAEMIKITKTLYKNEWSSFEGGRITGRYLKEQPITWVNAEEKTGSFSMYSDSYNFTLSSDVLTIAALGEDSENLVGSYKQALSE